MSNRTKLTVVRETPSDPATWPDFMQEIWACLTKSCEHRFRLSEARLHTPDGQRQMNCPKCRSTKVAVVPQIVIMIEAIINGELELP